MKLTITYTGDKSGFNLEQNLEANIENDAEALGYITNVLFETANVLAQHLSKVNPKYETRINLGISKSTTEKLKEENSVYPFTTFLLNDN